MTESGGYVWNGTDSKPFLPADLRARLLARWADHRGLFLVEVDTFLALEGEREGLRSLEEAFALFEVEHSTLDPASRAARGKLLYAQADALGLREPGLAAARIAALREWGFTALARYAAAAGSLLAYAASPERKRRLGDEPLHVAIDMFHWPQVPAVTHDLLASVERSFARTEPVGQGGVGYMSQGGFQLRIFWRMVEGRHVFYCWA